MSVKSIVASYVKAPGTFETARDRLHALDPATMVDVLALATARKPRGLDLLVMTLADVAYPPALASMRRWIEADDLEAIAFPAACALARFADDRFDTDSLYRLDDEQAQAMLREIAAWWDTGEARVPSEAEWLAAERARRQRDADEIPPPSPTLSSEENAALTPDVIALKQTLESLPPAVQHRLDVAAIRRVLSIYAEYAPRDRVLEDAVTAIEQFLAGGADPSSWARRVERATADANDAAGWSRKHHRWRVPHAHAAGQVAQGVLYALSPEVRNRLQAMHGARHAIEYAGRGFAAVRAELDWQLAQVRAAGR